MVKLGWFAAMLFSLSVYAQDVVVNPPLSIEPEAGQRIKQDQPPVTEPPHAVVDGQLKLEDKKAEVTPAPAVPVVPVQSDRPAAPQEISVSSYQSLEKYIQFSFGYLDSKWEKIDPSLENGSTTTSFRVAADMSQHNQFGFAIELVSDKSSQSAPENIRAVQYKLFLDHHRPLFAGKLDGLVGLALSIGDYSLRKLELNGAGQEVYRKIGSGTLYGLVPSAGLRFYLGERNSIDIVLEYHQYLSKPQSHIGGLALAPRFSFVF